MNDRNETLDLEIDCTIFEIERTLTRSITPEERWIIQYAFYKGNSFGLGEARQLIRESK